MCDDVIVEAVDTPEEARARHLLTDLGFCGHYMHFHGGGVSGKAPIVCLLAKQENGDMSQQELGSHFDLKPGSLSEVVRNSSAGMIERTRNPKDRRQLFIRLTEIGWQKARSAPSAPASALESRPLPA